MENMHIPIQKQNRIEGEITTQDPQKISTVTPQKKDILTKTTATLQEKISSPGNKQKPILDKPTIHLDSLDALGMLRILDMKNKKEILNFLQEITQTLKELTQAKGKLTHEVDKAHFQETVNAIEAQKRAQENSNIFTRYILPIVISIASIATTSIECISNPTAYAALAVELAELGCTAAEMVKPGCIPNELKHTLMALNIATALISVGGAVKKAGKKTMQKTAKEAGKKMGRKIAKNAAKKSIKEGSEEIGQQMAKRSAKEGLEEASQETVKKMRKELTEEICNEYGKRQKQLFYKLKNKFKKAPELDQQIIDRAIKEGIEEGLTEGLEQSSKQMAIKGGKETSEESVKKAVKESVEETGKEMNKETITNIVKEGAEAQAASEIRKSWQRVNKLAMVVGSGTQIAQSAIAIKSGVEQLKHLDKIEKLKKLLKELEQLLVSEKGSEEIAQRMEKVAEEVLKIIMQASEESINSLTTDLKQQEETVNRLSS